MKTLTPAIEKLLAAERLIVLAQQDLVGKLNSDHAGRLNSSLHFIGVTREQLMYESNRVEAIRSTPL